MNHATSHEIMPLLQDTGSLTKELFKACHNVFSTCDRRINWETRTEKKTITLTRQRIIQGKCTSRFYDGNKKIRKIWNHEYRGSMDVIPRLIHSRTTWIWRNETNKNGVDHRNSGVFKEILKRISMEITQSLQRLLVARTSFLMYLFHGSATLSTFQFARPYTPAIAGIPSCRVPRDIMDA